MKSLHPFLPTRPRSNTDTVSETIADLIARKSAHDAAEPKKAHGARYNDGKLKWSLVVFAALEPMVRVLMFGAQKYGPRNWLKGLDPEEVLESAQRHLSAMIDGEKCDPESGLPHVGHLMCNCMFYAYFTIVKPVSKCLPQ